MEISEYILEDIPQKFRRGKRRRISEKMRRGTQGNIGKTYGRNAGKKILQNPRENSGLNSKISQKDSQ